MACVTSKPIRVRSDRWKVGDGKFHYLILMKQLMKLLVLFPSSWWTKARLMDLPRQVGLFIQCSASVRRFHTILLPRWLSCLF